MSTFKTFGDIEAWQKARVLARRVYSATDSGRFSKDFGLKDQIRRACISIMANIAEGFDRGGRKEFIQFLSIAKGSAGEVKSHLFVALDQAYLTKESFQELYDLADQASKMISGLISYLQKSTIKGIKYK